PGAALGGATRGCLAGNGGGSHDWRVDALHVSTLAAGGALGSVSAFPWILPAWGDRGLLLASAIFLSIAGLVLISSERLPARPAETRETKSSPHRGLTLWGFAAFASLFAWERILAQIYGPFPELPARVLALFLFGVTVGGLAVLLWPLPKPSPLRLPALSFLTGLAYALPLVLVNRIPLLFLSASAVPHDSASFALRIWGIGALVVMPAAMGLGAQLPTLMGNVNVSLEQERPREHRDSVASVLGGGLLSSAVVAFWALPMLGF